MTGQSGLLLIDLLHASPPDLNRIMNTFITGYNTARGTAGDDRWDITPEEWQRYELLGDRVLNLVVAKSLFMKKDVILDEGEMTRILSSVVSNRALETLTRQYEKNAIMRLIPHSIREQNIYGERITGGSFEAFIGALYEIMGFEGTCIFILNILSEEIKQYNPATNYIGRLQEWHQQHGLPIPVYSEITEKRDGPVHSPRFTYRVYAGDGSVLGEGTGRNTTEAKQVAAKMALDKLPKLPD